VTDLGELLQNFRRSAFRLETLEHYTVPQEAEWFATWRRTGRLPELTPDNDSWLRMVRDHTSAGRVMQRVRVVSTPLTDYERFELALFPPSLGAGEDIRVISRSVFRSFLQVGEDFWLFDSQMAVMLRYDSAGRFLRAEPGQPDLCQRRCDEVLARSIPLKEYLVTLGPPAESLGAGCSAFAKGQGLAALP
jgi:hypothetical protein